MILKLLVEAKQLAHIVAYVPTGFYEKIVNPSGIDRDGSFISTHEDFRLGNDLAELNRTPLHE